MDMSLIRQLKKSVAVGCFAAAGLVASGALAGAATYNAAADFSLASNANGVWSYLYSNTLMTTTVTGSNYEYWGSGLPVPNSIIVGHAITGTAASGTVQFGSTYLTLDPESQTVDVRFTAPSAGLYTINGRFFGADSQTNCGGNCAAHPVLITDSVSGTVFGPDTITTYLQSYAFSFSLTMAANETLDFLAQAGTSGGCTYCNLATGLEATIVSTTPLPATLPLMASGVAGFYVYRRKKLRRRD
jgi:hypothetical protein